MDDAPPIADPGYLDEVPFDDIELANLKVPPHSIEAEQAVLGGLMIANGNWDNVADVVTEGDFFRPDHRLIFQAINRLASDMQPLDVVTLSEALNTQGVLENAGGLAYLAELANNTPSAANIRAYAEIVNTRATTRRMIDAAQEIANIGFNPEGRDTTEMLDVAERMIMQISEERPSTGGLESVNPILKSTIDKIDELFNSDEDITGLSTGFADLDNQTSGLQESDLIIVAARPSMGKTSFAMNLVETAALTSDKPTLVFSMEMPSQALVLRMLSSIGRIDSNRLRTGKLLDEDWPKLSAAVSKLKDKPLYIDDSPALSPNEIRTRARRVFREHGGISMIMVDYLQLMQIPGGDGNRTNEISEISRSLKAIAKEFNCPMVALSQLNRSLEQRPNKRPVMSDLRESGAIEQDADIIAFIYRDEVYNEDSPDKGIAEIIIGKQRNGPIGTCRLAFIGKFTRFENLSFDSYGQGDPYE